MLKPFTRTDMQPDLDLDTEIAVLRARLATQQAAEAALLEARERLAAERDEAKAAAAAVEREQADVEALEGLSLGSLLLRLRGERDQRMRQELAEVESARENAAREAAEAAAAGDAVAAAHAEVMALRGDERRLRELLAAKASRVREAGGERAEQLRAVDERYEVVLAEARAMQELVREGMVARGDIGVAEARLEKARSWGKADLLSGSMLVDMAKENALGEAVDAAAEARKSVGRFRQRIASLGIHMTVEIGLEALDTRDSWFYLDGLIADLSSYQKIQDGAARLKRAGESVSRALEQLAALGEEIDGRLQAVTAERDRLITGP